MESKSFINLSVLAPARGSHHRRKILGRGEGSGHGQTSTRGQKGQRSRSGDGRMMGFEGGQTPLLRRIPKRGFNNARFKKYYVTVNLQTLERYFSDGDAVTMEELIKLDIIKNSNLPVKVLAEGKLKKKLFVKVHAASAHAKAAIEKAGGSLELVSIQHKP